MHKKMTDEEVEQALSDLYCGRDPSGAREKVRAHIAALTAERELWKTEAKFHAGQRAALTDAPPVFTLKEVERVLVKHWHRERVNAALNELVALRKVTP